MAGWLLLQPAIAQAVLAMHRGKQTKYSPQAVWTHGNLWLMHEIC